MTALDNLRYTAALIGIEPGVRDDRIIAALDRVASAMSASSGSAHFLAACGSGSALPKS
jgi:hypothetical protein